MRIVLELDLQTKQLSVTVVRPAGVQAVTHGTVRGALESALRSLDGVPFPSIVVPAMADGDGQVKEELAMLPIAPPAEVPRG